MAQNAIQMQQVAALVETTADSRQVAAPVGIPA
jgi:hypothetical protein